VGEVTIVGNAKVKVKVPYCVNTNTGVNYGGGVSGGESPQNLECGTLMQIGPLQVFKNAAHNSPKTPFHANNSFFLGLAAPQIPVSADHILPDPNQAFWLRHCDTQNSSDTPMK